MKVTVDIPDKELKDAMRYTRARIKREVTVTAIAEFNQRRRMADLIKYSGTSTMMMSYGPCGFTHRERKFSSRGTTAPQVLLQLFSATITTMRLH